jgi:polyisoprenoid-binding protein YceI
MKKIILVSTTALLLFAFRAVESTTWSVDPMHSRFAFSINHLGVNDIEGDFKKYECKITTGKEDFSDAVVEVSAEIASINTEAEKRDEHLKSAEFFDAAKFATLSFKSKSVKHEGTNKLKISGDLTLHGVTKPVELEATYHKGINPMSKKDVVGFKITGMIKRSDFGVGATFPAPMLSDEVMLMANGEFGKK